MERSWPLVITRPSPIASRNFAGRKGGPLSGGGGGRVPENTPPPPPPRLDFSGLFHHFPPRYSTSLHRQPHSPLFPDLLLPGSPRTCPVRMQLRSAADSAPLLPPWGSLEACTNQPAWTPSARSPTGSARTSSA